MQTKRISTTESEARRRPSQKSYTDGDPRHVTGSACEALIRNAMALYPDLPAAKLVEKSIEIADADFLAELDGILRAQHLTRTAIAVRASERREQAAQGWLFPEIRTIASSFRERVAIGDKKTVERAKVCYEDLEKHLKVLNQRNRERHKKEIAATLALMALWPPRTKKTQGITLAEVDAAKARAAGLI